MRRVLFLLLLMALPDSSFADSFRCQRKIVKVGESSNALVRKCGAPARKYSARQVVTEHGREKRVGVSNWVYQRRGKKDMVISVSNGIVINIQVD